MRVLSHLFENNQAWSAKIRAADPDFFYQAFQTTSAGISVDWLL